MTSAPDLSTSQAAIAYVKTLSSSDRDNLDDALRHLRECGQESELLDQVRATLGADLAHVAGVVFTADAWDNGYFIAETGKVIFTDGRDPREVTFTGIGDLLTDLHGTVGPYAGYAVIPATGDTEYTETAGETEDLPFWVAAQCRALIHA